MKGKIKVQFAISINHEQRPAFERKLQVTDTVDGILNIVP